MSTNALPPIRERDFQRAFLELATRLGWKWYHTFDSRRDPAGFPDIVLVRGPRLLFVELKRDTTYPRASQREWLEALRAVAGIEVYVWRPKQWEEIVTILQPARSSL